MKYLWITLLTLLLAACGTVKPSGSPAGSGADNATENQDGDAEGNTSGNVDEEPGVNQDEEAPDNGSGTTNPDEINAENLSLASFEQTTYAILRDNCTGCHSGAQSPFIAHEDVQTAFNGVMDNRKVDFDDIPASRLVVRLAKDNHQCWSADCAADAAEMQASIEAWKAKIDEAGIDLDEEAELVTTDIVLAMAQEAEGQADPGTIVMAAAGYSDLVAPMEMRNDDADGDIDTYLLTPAGNGGLIAPNAAGGEAYYTFEITQPGTYAVYGRIKSPSGNANSFHISMDNGAVSAWGTAVSMNDWVWDRANQQNGMAELTYTLDAGTHTLMIKQREEETRFNRIAITNQLDGFEGAEIVGEAFELRYDLSDVTGKNATLVVEASIFDEASVTYKLRNLRIETDESITIKDVMPRINGKWNPQHATYRIVDQVVEAPGATLSPAALIIIGEDGWEVDELSFGFGVLE